MKPSMKTVVRKRPGRPATGQDPVTAIRLSAQLRASVDTWAAKQSKKPGRSEAIRRLVELGLAKTAPGERARVAGRALDLGQMAKISSTPKKVARSSRARELAAEVIERMIDPSASADERDQRRRRLTKGPPEFREHRVDLPKVKK